MNKFAFIVFVLLFVIRGVSSHEEGSGGGGPKTPFEEITAGDMGGGGKIR